VEDDPLVGTLLAEVLEDMGYDVCPVEATEAGAVSAAARLHPDLMIVDIKLGSGSGIVAMAEILHSGFVPHMFMTGNISRLRELPPEAVVLSKPFNEAQLARGIHRVLALSAGPG
jgi:CheY-like chemotaxis protein